MSTAWRITPAGRAALALLAAAPMRAADADIAPK
jgi:hypothetical protein